jgi:two-component system catabolic regulation response regulator CreB
MASILVVEDDPAISEAVVYALSRDGIAAEACGTVAAARERLRGAELLVLDLTLPDGSGFDLLEEIRRDADAPRVIVLTSRDEDVDCVAALEAGADDFVTKPFSPRALVARVRAVLRRGHRSDGAAGPRPSPAAAGLSIDAERRRVTYEGREIALTKIEFDLLATLAASPGRVRTRSQLVAAVWGPQYALTERTVDSHFKGLRRKLEEGGAPPNLVETVRGVGFRLRERDAP